MIARRLFLSAGAVGLMMPALAGGRGFAFADASGFKIIHTKEEWRAMLTPDRFKVLREKATERPFTSPLNDEHRAGVFSCAGCGRPLFSSTTKFDSGSGWPSFWAPIEEGAVKVVPDTSHGMARTEIVCADCGGHLGHVFDDGPKPTGERHCVNGVALDFKPTPPREG